MSRFPPSAHGPCPTSLAAGTIYYPTGAALANPNLANTTTWFSEGLSSYNALAVDVNRRFSHGLQIRGVYTFSKSLDDGTALNSSVGANAPGFVMFPLIPSWIGVPSTSDVRHIAVINASYELPIGQGKRLFGSAQGWRKSWPAVDAQRDRDPAIGFPFTPQLGYQPVQQRRQPQSGPAFVEPGFHGPVILGGPNQYFNPNAFILPPTGTYGNVGRDVLTGPGLATTGFLRAEEHGPDRKTPLANSGRNSSICLIARTLQRRTQWSFHLPRQRRPVQRA